MGRKPNPLILEFFERGAKLTDNSNRYHHRCKACGEDFPKGRIDSLINHLTKKCPAISEADRINACLSLYGLNNPNGSNRSRHDRILHSAPNPGPMHDHQGQLPLPHNPLEHQTQSQIWTPLETLAEVSRQIEAKETQTDAVQRTLPANAGSATANSNPFELHEQFTLENPPMNLEGNREHNRPLRTNKGLDLSHNEAQTAEDRLRRRLLEENFRDMEAAVAEESALSVAAAAAARLHPSLLDPQLLTDESAHEHEHDHDHHAHPADMLIDYPPSPEQRQVPVPAEVPVSAPAPTTTPAPVPAPMPATTNASATPWDGMTYIPHDIHAPATVHEHGHHLTMPLNRGGFRMDTSNSLYGQRNRHSRARFDTNRRKEVQEVRRLGACIRCRILRKVCSPGTPCATCKKVLHPRVWRTGCVRTKLSEYIDLYSAGVQVVMAQKMINRFKGTHHLENTGVVIEASHFPETGHKVTFEVLQGRPKEGDGSAPSGDSPTRVILLDNNKEDIPAKVENYMRQALPELIRREPSHYVRVTLDMAVAVAQDTNDELLKRSLELWGIVEMMDRERQWTMLAKSPKEDVKDYWINDEFDSEAYTNICMQLTAAAERKASAASKNLLNGIQRGLQDGKFKPGFPMFLTAMLFLNCMEKTTWAFKAWDEENLRPKWPLEKPPSSFTNQGMELTELLRMLLGIRHILPKTVPVDANIPITTKDEDPVVQNYFQHLAVTPAYLHMRREQNNFQPTDSRSLEFMFCSPLLLD
ncbi:hypothetical protein M426DRAFT_10515 [Hypoxylon sp. CI-4A]|nr:hypothetical protein M426DRAFT_10515 [Hypoxylon sp. CI-4A]